MNLCKCETALVSLLIFQNVLTYNILITFYLIRVWWVANKMSSLKTFPYIEKHNKFQWPWLPRHQPTKPSQPFKWQTCFITHRTYVSVFDIQNGISFLFFFLHFGWTPVGVTAFQKLETWTIFQSNSKKPTYFPNQMRGIIRSQTLWMLQIFFEYGKDKNNNNK